MPTDASANRRATVAETVRLLGLVTLPPGARPWGSAPAALPGPALGAPLSSSLVDTVRYWRVDLPAASSIDWVRIHPPQGLSQTGTSSSTGPRGDTVEGVSFSSGRTDPAWRSAEVQISVAPDGARGSFWRVDAMALWVDAVPERAGGGDGLVVTATCPATDSGTYDVAPTSATPSDALLPVGPPVSGLVCAYSGGNGVPPFALRQQSRLGTADARRLAGLAAAIAVSHVDGVVTTCPEDDGTATVVAFTYPGGEQVALWLKETGCPSISNGVIVAGFPVGGDSIDLNTLSEAVARLLHG